MAATILQSRPCSQAPCDPAPCTAATETPAASFTERAMAAAGFGGWELDVATGKLAWTSLAYAIHEWDPSAPPSLEAAVAAYQGEARATIAAAIAAAINNGTPWDLELPFTTAGGRAIWIRTWGNALREAGKVTRLTGALKDVTNRRMLAREAERLSVVARQMTNAVIITDPQGRTEWVNGAFERLTSFTLPEMLGRSPGQDLQGPLTDPETIAHMRERLAAGQGFDVEIINYTRDRTPYWIAVTCTPIRDDAGALTGFIAVESDVTARRTAEGAVQRETDERKRAEALLRDVLGALPSAVTVYDADEKLILTNRAYADMFPISVQAAQPGRTLEELMRYGVVHGAFPEAGDTVAMQEAWIAHHLAAHRNPGAPHSFMLASGRHIQARESRSESGIVVCIRSDTTELKRAEAELRILAERDSMTGLANRQAFLAALDRALHPAAGCPEGGTLLLFDVDHFKSINDTYGHDAGDALLIEIAARLRAQTRAGDLAVRLGGDEFVVLMPGLILPQAVAARVAGMQKALAAPVQLGGRCLQITTSAGVTMFPEHGTEPEQLLKTADLAMYQAKRGGRARWCYFESGQARTMQRDTILAGQLRAAIAASAMRVALQPQRLLRGGHAGFEAMACWHNGERDVPPAEFMPIAEKHGLAVPLGQAVLNAALARLGALRARRLHPGRIAINVAGPFLLHENFTTATQQALHAHGLQPADLELEITESTLVDRGAERLEATLHAVRQIGITITLDNFGTGHASLAHLARLPIDRLKIDHCFVSDIGENRRGSVITRTIISMARGLNMESIADGVATEAQLHFLQTEGCTAAQGPIFASPLITEAEQVTYLMPCCDESDSYQSRPVDAANSRKQAVLFCKKEPTNSRL